MNVFVFDIETIPDVQAGRRLHDLRDLPDAEVAQAMYSLQRQAKEGSEFLPHYLHQIVAISAVLRTPTTFKVWSLGETQSGEKELLQRFFEGLRRFSPQLISWNGSGFDLPVIHYRSLLHGVTASRYWENGETESDFRWNNYLNRYHERHLDLMDVLAAYQAKANAPLDKIATLLGFPGKMGMHGSHVWEYYLAGKQEAIRYYCETDVLNTYLVYLRFQLIRGKMTEVDYQQECQTVQQTLAQATDKPHLQTFLQSWQQ